MPAPDDSVSCPELINSLHAVLGRLPRPVNWTRGAVARDGAGNPVEPDDDRARRWSLDGAISLLPPDMQAPVTELLLDQLRRSSHTTLAEFNDAQFVTLRQIRRLIVDSIERVQLHVLRSIDT